MLSDEQVQDFQRIYKKTFGKDISRKDAYGEGSKLVHAMETVYQPVSKKAFEQHDETKRKKM